MRSRIGMFDRSIQYIVILTLNVHAFTRSRTVLGGVCVLPFGFVAYKLPCRDKPSISGWLRPNCSRTVIPSDQTPDH